MSDSYWSINSGGKLLTVRLARGNRATIAEVTFNDGATDTALQVTGEALLHPGDKRNHEIGDHLALSRAFGTLSRRLGKRAEGLTKHYDDIKKMQEA